MKIQKGLVKYKDRSDIVCTYAVTDDGRQFYFLNDSKLSNDNIIVTTSLVEAIDPSVLCSNIGVINANGDVVVECTNKAIKLITKDILLVEPSNPTSPSVIDSMKMRKDPLAATNLVSTPAVIKEKIYALMGIDGRFLFNDQFSEATLCDLNGNNLLENRYYSFISLNRKGDTLYLCGNTKESVPDTFSLVTMKFNDTTIVESEAVVPEASQENVAVEDATVTKEEIDEAMAATEAINAEEAPQPEIPSDATLEEPVEEVPAGVDIVPPVEVPVPDVEDLPAPENLDEVTEVSAEEVEEATNADEEDDYEDTTDIQSILDIVTGKTDTENLEEEIDDMVTPEEEVEKVEEIEPEVVEPKEEDFNNLDTYVNDVQKIEEEPVKNKFDEFLANSNFDYGNNNYDREDYSSDDDIFDDRRRKYSGVDSIMNDAASTLSKLISVNKSQQNEIDNYKDQVRELTNLNKKVVDKARQDRDRMKDSISNYESEIDRLKSQMDSLEDRMHEKERIINSQNAELNDLRVQMEGRNNLQKILEDAESLLGNSNY